MTQRTRRAMAVASAVSLLLAALSMLGLVVVTIDGYRWPDSSAVPFDGKTHLIGVSPGDTVMIWDYEADLASPCHFEDPRNSAALPTTASAGNYRRSGGSAGSYVGRFTIESPADAISARCPEVAGVSPLYIERAPWLPPLLAQFGGLVVLPLLLAVVGMLLALAVILGRGRRTDQTSTP